jgi:hypothetical protein
VPVRGGSPRGDLGLNLTEGEIADRLLDKPGLRSKADAGDSGQQGRDGQEEKSSRDQLIDAAKDKKPEPDQDGN